MYSNAAISSPERTLRAMSADTGPNAYVGYLDYCLAAPFRRFIEITSAEVPVDDTTGLLFRVHTGGSLTHDDGYLDTWFEVGPDVDHPGATVLASSMTPARLLVAASSDFKAAAVRQIARALGLTGPLVVH